MFHRPEPTDHRASRPGSAAKASRNPIPLLINSLHSIVLPNPSPFINLQKPCVKISSTTFNKEAI
jgi:hypothetical protein